MDFARAQEIFESPETIEVLYQDAPIWIEELDEETQMARIQFETGESKTVPVAELREQ